MSRLICILALILLLCSSASAQTHKVLIVSPDGENRVQALKTTIEKYYDGIVAVLPSLPPDLSFDAIFAGTKGWGDESLFDAAAQSRLIDYLKSGGRFYAEGDAFRTRTEGASNILWDFLGDSSEIYTAMVIDLTRIRGIDSEFTVGIDVADDPYEPNGDAGGGFHIDYMRPLLLGNEYQPLAWAPVDRNIKVVLNWPIGNPQYDQFLARVLCTHFQLCALDVAKTVASTLRLSFDPIRAELHLPAFGHIIISDFLGREVMHAEAGERYQLPRSLAKGSYIVRWWAGTARASTSIHLQ